MQSDSIRKIHARVEQMRNARAPRDRSIHDVRLVRNGRIEELHPDLFADDFPKSTVANIVDVAARDTAELIAPLPALACVSGNMHTAADKARAAKKNKIGSYYWEKSKLAVQNINFADSTNCYTFGTWLVEPDFKHQCPRIRFESSFGAYYFKDRWGQIKWYAKERSITAGELAAQYPDREAQILGVDKKGKAARDLGSIVKVVRYQDDKEWVVYSPDCDFLILSRVKNPIGRVAVVIAERPDTEDQPRGQYDDAVYPSLAKSILSAYMLKNVDQMVNAPWAMPDDVTEMPFGADSILRSQNPEKIQRVQSRIPQDVFAFVSDLGRDAKEGARYPEARTGGIQGNIVTGRGVQELMGTMDTQVRTMQTILGEALEDVTSICFEMDEALWPNVTKHITGVVTNKPFELDYVPARDIAGSYECKVTYGFASGQSPAQAIVALLQLRGDNLVSRDTVRRQLPFDIDVEEEQREVDNEHLTDSLGQGFAALLQALPAMVMQQQDPMPVLLGAAKAIQLREKGKPLYAAIIEAMTPEEKPEPEALPAQEQAPPGLPGEEAPPEGGLPPGIGPDGLAPGVAPGQAGRPPGGMPDMASLMAKLRGSGPAQMEATVSRRRAIR